MANKVDRLQGLNLLSFDGGGITGLSSLYIIREIMVRLQAKAGLPSRPEPWEYFDLIAGTGTGAVSAIMLGRLKLKMDDAIGLYHQLMSNTFSAKKRIALGTGFKATQLEEGLRNMVLYATGNAEEMLLEEKPQDAKCKVVVYAMSAHNMNASLPCAFRTYPANANVMPDCPIWKALRATMAHPELFKSVEIEEQGLKHQFIGGALGCNNPTAELLKEASTQFPTRFVSSVISIGAGHAQTIQLPKLSRLEVILPFGESLALRLLRAAQGIAEDCEKVAEDMAIRFSHTSDFYFRLNVDQGMQSIESSDWEKQSAVAGHTRAYILSAEVNSRLEILAKVTQARQAMFATTQIDGRLDILSQEENFIPNDLNRKDVPYISLVEDFSNEELGQHVFVFHGLGGAGKTQIALKCAELMANRFEGIIFIDGSSRSSIEAALCQLAIANNVGKEYTDMLQWLEQRSGRWLLFFDNADDPSVRVYDYFPRADRYDILITTRNKAVARQARGQDSDYKIDEMDPEEGLELLLEAARLRKDMLDHLEITAAFSLLQDFGYLALAIVQSGAFICRTQCTVSHYYRMYLNERQGTLEDGGNMALHLDDYDHSVFTTWALNKPLIGTATEKLWNLFIYMHRSGISETIFRRAYENLKEYDPKVPPSELEAKSREDVADVLKIFANDKGAWSSRLFFSAMGELVCLSMVDFDTTNNVYHLHPLVQQWARATTQETNALEKSSYLLALSINTQHPFDAGAYKRTVLFHVSEILDTLYLLPNPNDAWQFATVYRAVGHTAKAEPLEAFVVKNRTDVLGPEHPDTILSMEYLAISQGELGRLKQAEEIHTRLLSLRKRVLGEDHPDTLSSMENLADIYHSQGRLTDAETLITETLSTRIRVLGEEDPDTLWGVTKLAFIYRSQGRLADAESLEVELLAARKRVLREDHPDTLLSTVNLAATYYLQNRLADAESLEFKALAATKRVLGEDHPLTLLSMGNLATTYCQQGRLADAESLAVESLSDCKRVLGENHPDTLSSMAGLADIYRNQGRLADAESLAALVLRARKRVLGDDHHDTLLIMGNLAAIYHLQGRLAEAELLAVETLSARKRALGEDHPDTLSSMGNLAATYHRLGRLADAELLETEILATRKRVLEEDHPDTLTSMAYLAKTYRDQCRLADAESLEVELLAARKQALGEDHPDTLLSMGNLARTYYLQWRLADAELLEAEVLAARKRVLGEDHPITLLSMGNLATTYCQQGRLADAESLATKALCSRKRVLGENHPGTLSSMASLADIYRSQGRLTEAESLATEALSAHKRVLGDDHPDTLLSMVYLATTYFEQGRLAEAESLETKVLSIRKRALGETHPCTMSSMANLTDTYRNQGRLAEAETLGLEALAARKQVLGESHPDTQVSMRSLALTYRQQGRHHEYEALMNEVNAVEAREVL